MNNLSKFRRTPVCAYCGKTSTEVRGMEIEESSGVKVVWFNVYCNYCSKIDRPSILEKDMLLFLMGC